MVNCIWFNPEPVGKLVTACCGGKERMTPVFECKNPAQKASYCHHLEGNTAFAAIQLPGQSERITATLAGCPSCSLREEVGGVQSVPVREINRAEKMWMDIRRRRRFEKFDPPVADWSSTRKSPHQEFTDDTRHLIYHVGAFWKNDTWKRNIRQLLKRIHLFDGMRIIAVCTGEALEDAHVVKAEFDGYEVDFVEISNRPSLREVRTFIPAMERLEGKPGITFFGHTKGVTRAADESVTVHRWADMMYETCLDYMPLVLEQLKTFPITGSFKKNGYGFGGSVASWHYSGTYYWFRNRDVFSRRWRDIDLEWWGVESWPGVLFQPKEAGCLFHEGDVPTLDLYSMDYMKQVVEPAYEAWKQENAHWRQVSEVAVQST